MKWTILGKITYIFSVLFGKHGQLFHQELRETTLWKFGIKVGLNLGPFSEYETNLGTSRWAQNIFALPIYDSQLE